MASPAFLIAALLAIGCAWPAAADHSGPVFTISTCEDLQAALATNANEGFVLITIAGQVKCSTGQWSEEVTVISQVEVVGSQQRRGAPLPSIDFDNAGHLIHLAANASLRFESVILVERTVDSIGRLSNLNFISGDKGAMFAMAGVVIHYKLCPPPTVAAAPSTPTHTRIARSRNEDAGTLPSNNSTVASPHIVIKSVEKEEAGVQVFMCESLVACGVLNATVLEQSDRISRVDASPLCRFPFDAQNLPQKAPSPPTSDVSDDTTVVPLEAGQESAPASTSKSNNHMLVWASIGAVAGVLLVAMLLIYKKKHTGQRNKFITTTMIDSDSGEASGSPALGAVHVANPTNPFDQIPNKMMVKGKKPPPYGGGPSVSGLLSSWDMPEMGNIRVIRELPMSEAAPSEYNPDMAGGDVPVKLQLAGLDVQLRRLLGNGGHTSVYEGVYKHMECAMKIIEHDTEMLEMHGEAMEDYLTKDLVHPNVVKLCAARTCEPEVVRKWLKSLESGASTSASTPDPLGMHLFNAALLPRFNAEEGTEDLLNTFVVMEYCNGGTLALALQHGEFFSLGRKPNMPMVLMRAIDIAHAMEHLHAHCVVHGDLKPENVLLHRTHHDSCGFVCKVVDFGLRPRVAPHMLLETMSLATMAHLPPELLSTGAVSVATDVYSFGMILWGLVSGAVPFGGLKRSELIRHVVAGDRPTVPQSAPTKYARLIEECWHQEPMKRPDFRSITDRLRAIMFELERSSSSRPSSQASRPASQASSRPASQASVRRGVDAAAKDYDTSDTEDTDTIEDGYGPPVAHGNPRGLRFAPGAQEPARDRDSRRPFQGPERESARGTGRSTVQPVDRARMSAGPRRIHDVPPRGHTASIGSSNGNWEYDGDEERDSMSTLAPEPGLSLRRGAPTFAYGDHPADRVSGPPAAGHPQWSQSDDATDDDLDRQNMDSGRRPRITGSYRASD
ncbi:unnamed protein product [Ostreobium quekettii]|uniref:Protein kinase domain-containing protein n=1 Tax=Ostreobium quekettii TaxID=121088 RepID=A0A8S1J1T8_9CHLO|nr:unnamed protein product [Ostreobium quekettii]